MTAKRALVLVALVAVAWLGWRVVGIEPRDVHVRPLSLRVPHWPAALRGLRVAAMSDVHTGAPHVSPERLRALVGRVNAAEPEIVLLLGDYVIHGILGGRFVEPETTADILAGLRAPGGVVAVLGNHDWWYDGQRVRAAFEARSITVLENEARLVDAHGRKVWVAGLADLWTRTPDMERALSAVPRGAAVVLLSHSPDVFPDVPERVSLTLAGHTHGGQVRLPIAGTLAVPSRYGSRYAAGHVVEGGRHLFVTTGIGTSILPVRFRVPPEVVILTLE